MSAIIESQAAQSSWSAVIEDLPGEARRAHGHAARHCDAPGQPNCRWYHSALPTFRLLGVFDSPGCDDDFLLPTLAAEVAAGARRILLSGCADAGMLARIAACVPAGVDVGIVVLDRCGTPLELCLEHAAAHGLRIATVRSDILDYRAEPFDLVCTHSFLGFFDAVGREQLTANWWQLLRPGGCVVTAQRVRADADGRPVGYGEVEAATLAEDAARRAESTQAEFGVGADAARRLALEWTRNYTMEAIASDAELRKLFEAAGFVLEHCQPAAPAKAGDRPGTPRGNAGTRRRIVARRPAERAGA